MIRATTADETGNLSMEDEGTRGTVLSIAQATKAGPKQGTVMAQVRWLTKSWTINPRDVDIPNPLVDFVIVSPKEYHTQGGTIEYDPSISYRIVPPITDRLIETVTMREKKDYERIIAQENSVGAHQSTGRKERSCFSKLRNRYTGSGIVNSC